MIRSALMPLVSGAALMWLGTPSPALAQVDTSSQADTPSLRPLDTTTEARPHPADPSSSDPALLNDDPSKWRLELNSWIWLVGFSGDVTARGRTSEVDANFGDVLDASDSIFAFSGRIELGYGRIAAFVDGMYADLGADDQSGPLGLANIDVTLQQELIDFGLMYRIVDHEPDGSGASNPRNLTLDLYAGARYNSIEMELDPANLASRSQSKSWIDPIVGAKIGIPLSEHWHFNINADIGGFGVESDFTWSTSAIFGYDFEMFGLQTTIMAGYRAIGWDYSEGSGMDEFAYDLTQHGPILGFAIRF